jgi:FlaA1/EpsC-like NDP-sugar epimerase
VRQLGIVVGFFSIPDLLRVLWAMTAASTFLLFARVLDVPSLSVPRGVLMLDYFLGLGGLCAVRLATRIYRERVAEARNSEHRPLQRIAIIGAGDAGATLARDFLNMPWRGFKPVMFFDDDARKHGKLIHGVPVIGRPEQLLKMEPKPDIAKIVIAMPAAPGKRIRQLVLIATQAGLKAEIMPSLEELASGRVKSTRLRPVEIEDLLGRDPVRLDVQSIRNLIEGHVVMVTGAGGSIGSELCRQISLLSPKRLLMVEQAEGSMFVVEQELNEMGMATIALPIIGDILDRERMEFVFQRYHPEVVFHAAAHKHVFLMERQPGEAFRNNVLGTRQMAELAGVHGVGNFVLISTDKAINPTSVMGATKRLAEIQLQAMQRAFTTTKYTAVRFGNVLGSSGSVIPIFKRQIAHGGPVSVTHPEVTRFFMTIPEAVGLVLQSAVLGQGGEILVLDMGAPVKIIDLARHMIELSGYRVGDDIEIKFVGLRPGEKLYEELQHQNEQHVATSHPKIMRFVNPQYQMNGEVEGIKELERCVYRLESAEVKAALKRLVREYTPSLD